MTFQNQTADLLGVGFGPAALSVAVAIEDHNEEAAGAAETVRAHFLERASGPQWQPNMLLPGTDIQHHFLRDFATPRNPRSRFTFPSYLVDSGRFFPFTLMGGYVSRQEWSRYVEWTAEQITAPVEYGVQVSHIEPVTEDGRVTRARVVGVHAETGERVERVAENLLISVGHTPNVPDDFAPLLGDRVFHSSQYLPRISALPKSARRFAVIGAGQNAGEIVLHLASAFPDAEIHSLVRNSGFRMYNLGHFSNEAYFPAETDYFYGLDRENRKKVFDEVYSTNYASVDPDVSTALYRAAYEDATWGPGRLHLRKRTSVDVVQQAPGGGYRLDLREVNTGEADSLDVDVVILCTGYREPKIPPLLDAFLPHIVTDEAGEPEVTRAFRLEVTEDCGVGLYLNGITEWRHGINSATSFSTMAIKARDILADVVQRLDGSTKAADGELVPSLSTLPAG
jgi:L-ornithine N5-monooxygenase